MKRATVFIAAFLFMVALACAGVTTMVKDAHATSDAATVGEAEVEHIEAGAALAEGDLGHAPEGEAHASSSDKMWNFVYRLVNFALFIGILAYFAGGPIKKILVGRPKQIKEDLDDLETRKAAAEKKLKEVEAGIANMAQEKQSILDEAKKQGETLKAAIIEKAEKDAAAMVEQAKRTASNEAQAALESMRAEMAELVVDAAQKIVQERLSDADHDKLVDDYLTKVVLN